MPKLQFLVDERPSHGLEALIQRHLADLPYEISVAEVPPERPADFRWIIPWNYPRLISGVSATSNFVVFHSTALPDGRGWAPIYNTIVSGKSHYTISGIRLDEGADTGDILIQARFAMRPEYCASVLREWDEEICLRMIRRLLECGRVAGRPQEGAGEVYARRTPEDNEIDPTRPLGELLDHLRACESAHPAFFVQDGVRFDVSLSPATPPEFPGDLEITVFEED